MRAYDTFPLPSPNTTERFWSNVDRSGGPDACWEWQGRRTWNGHGTLSVNGKTVTANRVAFAIASGRWPKWNACHTCDNPPCCNPAHLFDASQASNLADMFAKGRQNHAKGERHGSAKLCASDIRQIRSAPWTATLARELAEKYGVSKNYISEIRRYTKWRHIE